MMTTTSMFCHLRNTIKWMLVLSLFGACRKDSVTNLVSTTIGTPNTQITLDEVMAKYATLDGAVNERSGTKLPLDATPLWGGAYVYNSELILTPVDTPCSCPNTKYGGNLAFYKDGSGEIKSKLLLWETDSTSSYSSFKAPLDSTSQFSGWMASVTEHDSINKILRVSNGLTTHAKKVSISFFDAANIALPDSLYGGHGVEDRDFWDWVRQIFHKIKCPSASGGHHSSGGSAGGGWDKFWSIVRGWFTSENIGDDESGELIYHSPFANFFGGPIVWHTPSGGYNVSDQQYLSQMSICTTIKEYIESTGDIPSGYGQSDLHFCQLVNDLGLSAMQSRCLLSQYGSAFIEQLWAYWDASNKSEATAGQLKEYIDARCEGKSPEGFSRMLYLMWLWPSISYQQLEYLRQNTVLQESIIVYFERNITNPETAQIASAVIQAKQNNQLTTQQATQLLELADKLKLNLIQVSWLIEHPAIINETLTFLNTHSPDTKKANVAKTVSLSYISMLMENDPVINQMMIDIKDRSVGDPIWDFLIEQLGSVLQDALIDILPGGTLITVGPQAIQQFKDGDWLGGLWTTATIVLDEAQIFIEPLKILDVGISIAQKSAKLSKFYEVMKKVYTLGDDAAYKVYQVLRNKLDKLYSKIHWTSNGAKITDAGDPLGFWDDFVTAFQPYEITGGNGNEIRAKFILGGSTFEMRFYPASSSGGEPTIVIKKGSFEFKMRF